MKLKLLKEVEEELLLVMVVNFLFSSKLRESEENTIMSVQSFYVVNLCAVRIYVYIFHPLFYYHSFQSMRVLEVNANFQTG
jgi:hypothetical protein